MLTKLKHLFSSKVLTEFHDPVLGVLVSRDIGTWIGDIPFESRSISLLMPGSRQQPSAACLAHAHQAVASLPEFVRAAREFAARKRPELSGERLTFVALNYCRREADDDFGLDFTEAGDDSGNCWQVDFHLGQPIALDYT
jgi:hypothetical protein